MGNAASPYATRKATYAGKMYSNDHDELSQEIQNHLNHAIRSSASSASPDDENLQMVHDTMNRPIRMILAPHTWNSTALSVSASAYQHLAMNPLRFRPIKTILVLHPHHFTAKQHRKRQQVTKEGFATGKCLISNAYQIETPLGNLMIDVELRNRLLQMNKPNESEPQFQLMTKEIDELEHSGELQYILLVHVLKLTFRLDDDDIAILPLLIGDLKTKDEIMIGNMLAPIINDTSVLTVISTEFCNWQKPYYQPWDMALPPSEFIHKLDYHGIRHIENIDAANFAMYLLETDNTISGRHAIAVWLHAIAATAASASSTRPSSSSTATVNPTSNNNNNNQSSSTQSLDVTLTKYAQSYACQSLDDSSVSYAAMVATTASAQSPDNNSANNTTTT